MKLNLNLIFTVVLAAISIRAKAQSADELAGAANSTLPQAVIFKSKAGMTTAATTNSAIGKCSAAAVTASTYCLSDSPKIRGAVVGVSMILSLIKSTKMTSAQACEKYSEALKISETGLTAYNAACAWVQSECSTDCTAAMTAINQSRTTLAAAQGNLTDVGVGPDLTSIQFAETQVQATIKQCGGYTLNMAAAGLGLKNVLAQIGQSVNCKNNTTVDCSVDKYNTACRTVVDCGKSENQNQTACICQRSPNSPGCAGYTGQSIAGQGSTSSNNVNAFERGSGNYVPSTVDSTPVVAGNGASSGSTPASGSMGSASSGLGSSGSAGIAGASAKTSGVDASKSKGYNTNILSSSEGGGGFAAGATRSLASQDSSYGAYIPGASKDPAASSKTTTSSSSDITGSGAKSNWEKVREMYSAKQTSLMGN